MKLTPTTIILALAAVGLISYAAISGKSDAPKEQVTANRSAQSTRNAAPPAAAATPIIVAQASPTPTPAVSDATTAPTPMTAPGAASAPVAGDVPAVTAAQPGTVPAATTTTTVVITPITPAQPGTAATTTTTTQSGTAAALPADQTGTNAATMSTAASGTNGAAPATTAAATPTPAPGTAADAVPPTPKNEIRMNFQGASLNDVLNYLSDAAGFIVIQDTPVTGTVNIISKQPVTAAEAVDLLNSVLVSKGYAAILNGRVLKIVSSHDAQKRDLPVNTSSDPVQIPKKDTYVTQIMPIRYVEAGKLIENLRPMLSADATISSNDNSNAIIMTDTQANIHRMAEIIHALDNSISSISSIHVFQLRYADAKEFAQVLTQLFNPDQANNRNGQQNLPPFLARFGGGGGGRGGGGGGGGGGADAEVQSEARKAASRVVAVADTQSNSVVVSAPEEYMATITEIVERLDTSTTEVTETRIFRLEHADCQELANVLNTIYGDVTTTNSANQQGAQRNNAGGGGRGGQPQQPQPAQVSDRQLQQARVVCAADPRTNSIIVNCSHDSMEQISLTIGRLDSTDSKKQHVYVINLQHADPDNVAGILRGMFSTTTSGTSAQSALGQRTTTGASSTITNTLNTGSGSSGRGAP